MSHEAPVGPTPSTYVVRVAGELDRYWVAWFEGLTLTTEHGETTISGEVRDDAALHGLLAKIRDLDMPLLEVRRVWPHREIHRRDLP
jgi:hypothetical protein